jgi:hypothetical protein
MNCVDLVEKVIESIITKLHEVFINESLDDSEYIRNVKAVLDGTSEYVQANKETLENLENLQQKLYDFSKRLWLSELKKRLQQESESADPPENGTENDDYYEYYFDYIYAHDNYPR